MNNLINYFSCRSPLLDHRARLCDIGGCILSASLPSLDQIGRRILRNNGDPGIVLAPSSLILSIVTFFDDYILGSILDNMSGAPSHENAAVYWTYFIVKMLTLLSWPSNHDYQ